MDFFLNKEEMNHWKGKKGKEKEMKFIEQKNDSLINSHLWIFFLFHIKFSSLQFLLYVFCSAFDIVQ